MRDEAEGAQEAEPEAEPSAPEREGHSTPGALKAGKKRKAVQSSFGWHWDRWMHIGAMLRGNKEASRSAQSGSTFWTSKQEARANTQSSQAASGEDVGSGSSNLDAGSNVENLSDSKPQSVRVECSTGRND